MSQKKLALEGSIHPKESRRSITGGHAKNRILPPNWDDVSQSRLRSVGKRFLKRPSLTHGLRIPNSPELQINHVDVKTLRVRINIPQLGQTG
jgi:hypothetical protein